ncbi:sensor histidine kinase [Rhodococcus aerolatus]
MRRRRRARRGRASLAAQLFVGQLLVLVLVVAVGATLAVLDARRDGDDRARREVLDLALSLAGAPSTAEQVTGPDPAATLQPEAEALRVATGVDFVVVMAPDRTRYSHPNPELLGQPFVGDIAPAVAGRAFTEVFPGTLGPSIRAVAPVRDDAGAVVGLVAVGITQEALGRALLAQLPVLLGVVALALLAAAAGSLLLSRRLRRQTLGLQPDELRTMYEHHDAVLHAVGEGLVVLDDAGAVVLANDQARRLLTLRPGAVDVADLPESLRELARRGDRVSGEVHVTGDHVLVVSQRPVTWEGRPLGSVLTLQDRTELQGVADELDSVRGFAESLRSQAHESANRLHTVVTMVELGRSQEAVEFATAELALSQHLIDRLLAAVAEPALAALLLGKVAQAAERGCELTVTEDTALPAEPGVSARDLVTVVGNLVDNAVDAALEGRGEAWVEVRLVTTPDPAAIEVTVADSGAGLDPAGLTAALRRGHSTKSGQRGLGLALVAAVLARHDGRLEATPGPPSQLVLTLPVPARAGVPG